jgi:surfactin synthase thioesterase subunit
MRALTTQTPDEVFETIGHRLFCIPQAGAGANTFAGLAKAAPRNLDVVAICLPGRERRLMEPALRRMEEVVAWIAREIEVEPATPFSILGQCSGAYAAVEVAAYLEANRNLNAHCVFVVSQAPPGSRAAGMLTAESYWEELVMSGEFPAELIQSAEFMEIFRESSDADIELINSYIEAGRFASINTRIVALYGLKDGSDISSLQAGWQKLTSQRFGEHCFEQGHLLTLGDQRAFMECLASEIGL